MGPLRERVFDLLAAMNTNTHSRYPNRKRDKSYTRSYRVIRLVVGVLGILLPIVLIIGEASFLRGSVHVRGSLSAYYHTSMRDIFVGGLCVVGFLLVTYMAGELSSWDFWASLIAGAAVLGVVFFPTSRPGLPVGAPACGSHPEPPGCSAVEQTLGEHTTAVIHAVCAVTFIVFLAVISFLFATSEVLSKTERLPAPSRPRPSAFRNSFLFAIHSICALVILAAGAWAFFGPGIGELTPLYIGEVASVWAFGFSWLLAGFYLTAPARPGARATIRLNQGGREQILSAVADPVRKVRRLLRAHADESDVTVSIDLPDHNGTLRVALDTGCAFFGLETANGIYQYVADEAADGERQFVIGGQPTCIDTRYVLPVTAAIEALTPWLAGSVRFASWEPQ